MTHIMIDLETLSTRTDAAILQIGAVAFDLYDDGEYEEINSLLVSATIESNMECERDISASTIRWWISQSEEARASLLKSQTQAKSLPDALIELKDWIHKIGHVEGVWGNGSTFDLTILKSAYERIFDEDAPWDFWLDRDTRTLAMIAPDAERPKPLLAHDALSDALSQATWVQNMVRDICAGDI